MLNTKSLYLLISGSMIAMTSGCSQKKDPVKPNILFILADDLGYHDLSCTGSKYYETPNVDRISREGMSFTSGYAACQVSSPSRASIMTGRFPARHGITSWIGDPSGENWRKLGRNTMLISADYLRQLPHELITLPEALKKHGYMTFFAGKWHLGGNGSLPEDHGFDINKAGGAGGSPYGGYFSPWTYENLDNHEEGEELSMRLAKETVKFLEEYKDTTFFAYLSFYAVHAPIQCSEEKWRKYRQKAVDAGVSDVGFKMGRYLPIRQVQDNPVYGGLVEAMDDAVGVVLNKLDDLGLAENTIVIFTSDNGGVAAGDNNSTTNLPLRAGKGYQFEGGIREPYFIKVPGLTKGGEECDVPVSGTDFYPTILDLAGARLLPDEHPDGVSLLPLLKGGSIKERALIWHYPHYGNQGGEPSSIIRRGDWKLIHYYEDGRDELYNLKADIGEKTDVLQQNPDIAKSLSSELSAYLKEVGAIFPQKDPLYDPELKVNQMEKVSTEVLGQLEKQRIYMLSVDFDPGNNWWGSKGPKN